MKNRIQKTYYNGLNPLSGNRKRTGVEKRVKSMDRHPYTKASFWSNPVNHFWENANYSEDSKEYFRDWLRKTTL